MARGIKVEGEGEWHARKHGGPKRRVWRKIHIRCPAGEWHIRREGGIDEETLEVRAVEVTSSDIGDAPMLPELLPQIPADQDIASVTADGAYDTRKCHDAIAERGAAAIIPPRKNAKPWKTVTAGAGRARRGPESIEIPRPRALATMERIPPPKPRRNQDALCETAGSAPHGARLRPSGRRVPGSCRRSERLHRARHLRHEGHGISLSADRGSPIVS